MAQRFLSEVQGRVHGMYLAVYQSIQSYSVDSVDEFLLREGITLESEQANNPTVRRGIAIFLAVDKILANLIAIPFAMFSILIFVPIIIVQFAMEYFLLAILE